MLEDGAFIEFAGYVEAETATWKCPEDYETDFRCGANWASTDDLTTAAYEVPCVDDTVIFGPSAKVDNSGLPFVAGVVCGQTRYSAQDVSRAADERWESHSFTAPFLSTDASLDPGDMPVAKVDCIDSCPALGNGTLPSPDVYAKVHDGVVQRREFLESLIASVGIDEATGYPTFVKASSTTSTIGRHPFYLVDQPGYATALRIEADRAADEDGYMLKVASELKSIFDGSSCVPSQFTLDFKACRGVEESNSGYKMPVDNVCGANMTLVATRPVSRSSQTCGEYNAAAQPHLDNSAAAADCCVPSQYVNVVACEIVLGAEATTPQTAVFAGSIPTIAQRQVHGVEGQSSTYVGRCAKDATIGTPSARADFVIDLAAAAGEYLTENTDFTAKYVVAAIAHKALATALAENKMNDEEFEAEYRLKKYIGMDPATSRRRRDLYTDIQVMVNDMIPMQLENIGNMVTGERSRLRNDNPDLVMQSMEVKWFQDRNGLATVDPVVVAAAMADVIVYFGLKLEIDALYRQEYAILTTSTTTTTLTTVTVTTTTATELAEESGTANALVSAKATAIMDSFKAELISFEEKRDQAESAVADIESDKDGAIANAATAKRDLEACDKKTPATLNPAGYSAECTALYKLWQRDSRSAQRLSTTFPVNLASANAKVNKLQSDILALQRDTILGFVSLVEYDPLINDLEGTSTYIDPDTIEDMHISVGAIRAQIKAIQEEIEKWFDIARVLLTNVDADAAAAKVQKTTNIADATAARDACIVDRTAELQDMIAIGFDDDAVSTRVAEYCQTDAAILTLAEAQLETHDAETALKKESAEDFTVDALDVQEFATEQYDALAVTEQALSDRYDRDHPFPLVAVIGGAAGAVILIIIIAVVLSGSSAPENTSSPFANNQGPMTQAAVAFENPMYAEHDDGYDEDGGLDDYADDGGGLYDEPEMYVDKTEEPAVPAGGGYLDVEPDDEDDDEEEDEEEEDEEQEEEEEEEEEEDDEEEESDDDDNDDEDDDDEDEDDSDE